MPSVSRRTLANAIRALSMDAVQRAKSGHPGMPMGMADIAQVLWQDFLSHNPKNPKWFNRDRFILSNGHGAMLQYSLLHLSGYDLSIEDLKNFRQWHSNTPGHPEYGDTPGVETTTGPLGQGIANGVGMALAEQLLAQQYNRPGHDIIDHWTYVFAGDGCLMEGVSHESCSLAGTLHLGKLVVFYDDNGISIDGPVHNWFSDDTPKRFESYGWQVIANVDGHDPAQVKKAVEQARANLEQPTLICCKTQIGFGSPSLAGTEKTHGSPLGEDEINATRAQLGWQWKPFEIPEDIKQAWDMTEKGQSLEYEWGKAWQQYEKAHPELAKSLKMRIDGQLQEALLDRFDELLLETHHNGQSMATRKASHHVLSQMASLCPSLMGGSADLTGSNLTAWEGCEVIKPDSVKGNYLHYGVREFGMSAIMNGLACHGGFIPFGGTFLTFLDYARNAVRLSALMKQQVLYVFTHDSIGLGEDGPTHQPVEHLAMLRATPHMRVWRPADDVETVVAWKAACLHQDGPTSLILTRQNVPHLSRQLHALTEIEKGAYIISDSEKDPQVLLLASGSEVSLCLDAQKVLRQEGIQARVISVPCMEAFKLQSQKYQQTVLPRELKNRIAIEAAHGMPWYEWVGSQGKVISLDHFGASAPYQQLYHNFGLTVERLVDEARVLIRNSVAA